MSGPGSVAASPAGGAGRVLLAEGSPAMRRLLELALTREGFQVIPVSDGARAIEVLTSERPDVVILDHALPGRSAFEVAAFVRSRPGIAGARVLLTAGAFEDVNREHARQAGCDDVLVKPIDLRRLATAVRARTSPLQAPHGDTDAYLARLSAALEERDRARVPPPVSRDLRSDEDLGVPTLDAILNTPEPHPSDPRDTPERPGGTGEGPLK